MAKNDGPALLRRFAKIDLDNPNIWRLFQRFTFEMIGRGFLHYSSDAVLHRVRWETDLTMKGNAAEHFKISNDFSCCYARKFRDLHPTHDKFFLLRASKVDPVWVTYKRKDT
jgi:hypothetical protein